jgi:hypothetical protein
MLPENWSSRRLSLRPPRPEDATLVNGGVLWPMESYTALFERLRSRIDSAPEP